MPARSSVDKDLVEAAARLGNLSLPADRAAELVPLMSEVFTLLDSLDHGGLGETPPACAFDASWREAK